MRVSVAFSDDIPTNVFRFVERELYDYPANKEFLRAYDAERIAIMQSNPQPDVHVKEGLGDRTPAAVIRLLALERKAGRIQWYVNAIEDVMRRLPELDQKLVELKYFQGYLTNEGVARELNIGRTTFYERRRIIIRQFAIRMGLL